MIRRLTTGEEAKFIIKIMSNRFVFTLAKLPKNCVFHPKNVIRNYSRKSTNTEGPYKIVKGRKPDHDSTSLVWRDPSFELLSSSGFPLFLRGNIGLAWFDTHTTIRTQQELIMEQIEDSAENSDSQMILRVQTCPTVLRQTVGDLFPYRSLENSELSVITLNIKPDMKQLRVNREVETERMAQMFVIAAKNICDKLRNSGFWADFVNPFSGRPYLVPESANELYKTHEKFRCLDFQIFEIQDCKVVSNEHDDIKKRFIGSLFTSAPCNQKYLNTVFSKKRSIK